MPIITDYKLPNSADALDLPADSNSPFFIAFLASRDPSTGRPWCPDVIAALPYLEATFSAEGSPRAAFIEVGQRPEWRDPRNVYRAKWNVNNTPTLARYERVDGKVKEVGRLVEAEILDSKRLKNFITSSSASL
uniref:Thioredoxin-like protein 5 n=1 Tax=Zea mays TaxID=4577 RepID=B6UDY6_MAIZE|nr:thioredoxin-like protein 5 [Zea mays]